MRIFIGAQPKTGNVWVRKLLCKIYALDDLNEDPQLDLGLRGEDFVNFVNSGRFPDNTIVQQHLFPSPSMLGAAECIFCHLVTVVRDPYDTFVSFYFYVNAMPQRFRHLRPGILIGKPIGHPDVLEFLRTRYVWHLRMARRWLLCGRASVVRYEELHSAPLESVRKLTNRLQPVPDHRIANAVSACSAERMRQRGGWLSHHVRSARMGEGKEHLLPIHLEIMRRDFSQIIEDLGYQVL
jgi:hypothetical protein